MFVSTSIAVIEELGPEQIAQMTIEELIQFLQGKGKVILKTPKKLLNIFKN